MKWLVIILICLSSCASQRYVASPATPPVQDDKKQKTNMELHICILAMTGFMYHFLNKDSD